MMGPRMVFKAPITMKVWMMLAMTPAPVLGKSLCHANEEIVLSCNVKSAKTFSFCRAQAPSEEITYRFGKSENIELEHKDKIGPSSSFFYGHYSRYHVDISHIGFEASGHVYTGYREWDEDDANPSEGLRVVTPSGVDVTLVCVGPARYDRLYDTRDLRCSDSGPVGCSQ